MKQLLSILISCLGSITSLAQSRADTSYSIHTEYQKLIKTHPHISFPQPLHNTDIKVEKDIVYGSTGTRSLYMDAFYPSNKKRANGIAIVLIHGGGWRTGNRTMMYALAERLADMGYSCFTPEYRLSPEALYPAAIHDINSAIVWVKKNTSRFNVDRKKIVVAGHSAGGQLAAQIGSIHTQPGFTTVNAVIDMDGILAFIHPESGEGDDSKKLSAATQWFGKSKTEDPELWKQGSPLTHVGKNNPPTLFINSSVARMHAGREDFIKILDQHHIYSRVESFEGAPHSFILFNPWFERTVGIIDNFLTTVFNPQPKKMLTVAQDGSGDFTTVQAAINVVPKKNKKPFTILVKNGIYKEKILVDSLQRFITLVGEDKLKTILTWDDHTGKLDPNGDTINTRTSWSFKIKADHFTARNITFRNEAGFSAGQAVAVESNGDKAIFSNCHFIGFQDVLFLNSPKSHQYFENCYIEGTTDFIFGSATAWFQHCNIYSKKNSHITAAATPQENEFGFVFKWCELDGDTSLHNVSLGRPWRPFAQVAYLYCYIGQHIKPEGWSVWNNNNNHLTTRFHEFGNYGPSANRSKRLEWTKELNKTEVEKYTIQNVLKGWDPKK